MVDRFLSKWAAIVDTVNNFVAEWRFPLSDIYLLKKGNVKPVKSSFNEEASLFIYFYLDLIIM